MNIERVVSYNPLCNRVFCKSGPFQRLSSEIRDRYPGLIQREAKKSNYICVLWVKDLKSTIDEDFLVAFAKLDATFPVVEDRVWILQLFLHIDTRVVIIDSHPWLDIFLAETCVGGGVPLHWSPRMIASLKLDKLSSVFELSVVIGILLTHTNRRKALVNEATRSSRVDSRFPVLLSLDVFVL